MTEIPWYRGPYFILAMTLLLTAIVYPVAMNMLGAHILKIVLTGLLAASLAKEGFFGPSGSIEGKDGFLPSYAPNPDAATSWPTSRSVTAAPTALTVPETSMPGQ